MKFDEFGNEIIDDEEIIANNDNCDDNRNDNSNDNNNDNDFSSDDDFTYERKTYRRANQYDRPQASRAKFSYNEVNKKEKKRYGTGVLIWSIIFAIFFGTLTGFGGAYMFNKANDCLLYTSDAADE